MKNSIASITLPGIFVISLFLVMLCGCITAPKLVEDRGATAYLTDKYGEIIYSGLNFYFSKEELATDIRILKETASADKVLGDKAKQQLIKQTENFIFIERGYLLYKFKIWSPIPTNLKEFKFEFNDQSGNTMIQDILPVTEKVRATGRSGNGMFIDQTYYSYIWMIKLKKPFTPKDLPSGIYKFSVIFPNSSSAIYEIKNK